MKSNAAIAGHPLHPMLVAVPIGLFVWTFVADLVYLVRDNDPVWYDIAYWTGIAAWISALVAALPGFVDFFTVAMKSDARDMGLLHMVLNLTIVGLYIAATLVMYDRGAVTGSNHTAIVIIHGLGSGLLLLSGWLGGEMVFRHHLGLIPDNGQMETEEQAQHVRREREAFR
jgi:uncharacterized membrane protein